MRVRIIIDRVWESHSARVQRVLEVHRERLLEKMPLLAEKFDFRPPARIDLRPMDPRRHSPAVAGRYWYMPGKGYSIRINMPYCFLRKDGGLWVVDHEPPISPQELSLRTGRTAGISKLYASLLEDLDAGHAITAKNVI